MIHQERSHLGDAIGAAFKPAPGPIPPRKGWAGPRHWPKSSFRQLLSRPRPLTALLALLLLVLPGCAGTGGLPGGDDPLADMVDADPALRAGGRAVIYVELATDRVVRISPVDAPTVYMFVMRVERTLERVRAASGLWVNADLFSASELFARWLVKRTRSRLREIVGRGGLNIATGLDLARSAGKGAALVLDVRNLLSAVRGGDLTEDEAWTAINDRVRLNRRRLEPLLGFTLEGRTP